MKRYKEQIFFNILQNYFINNKYDKRLRKIKRDDIIKKEWRCIEEVVPSHTRNVVVEKSARGFESHRLRQQIKTVHSSIKMGVNFFEVIVLDFGLKGDIINIGETNGRNF